MLWVRFSTSYIYIYQPIWRVLTLFSSFLFTFSYITSYVSSMETSQHNTSRWTLWSLCLWTVDLDISTITAVCFVQGGSVDLLHLLLCGIIRLDVRQKTNKICIYFCSDCFPSCCLLIIDHLLVSVHDLFWYGSIWHRTVTSAEGVQDLTHTENRTRWLLSFLKIDQNRL